MLRARAAEFVAEWVQWGAVLVLAPVREAADEVALEACGDALVGVHRLAFRELVLELSAAELNRRALVPVGRIVREALAARVTQEAVGAGAIELPRPRRRISRISARPRRHLRRAAPQRGTARPTARVRRIGRGPRAAPRRLSGRTGRARLRRPRHARRPGAPRNRGAACARRRWWRSTWRRAPAPSANCSR